MPNTNSWLCIYAIAQLGKPYWYATSGQISSIGLYNYTVKPAIISSLGASNVYSDYNSQLGVKVHDCSGLVVGALTCDTVTGGPTKTTKVAHGSTSQFNSNCNRKSNSMKDFPYIPGTLVFHTNGNSKSHVGIYVGTFIDKDGKEHEKAVVEAMSHKFGVITTSVVNTKWDSWGQLSICDIDTTTSTRFDARTLTIVGGAASVNIEARNMYPFVATVLPGTKPNLDYDQIKAARISAMMFFGGELYNSNHQKQTYVNSQLGGLVQQCNDAGMPYALYVNIRSRNEIEADAECRALYYIVSRYSPTLGLWLSLQTNNSNTINDKILEVYYRYISQWGLKARCGLYINKATLSKFTWNKFQDRFYLWLIEPMDVAKVDDELLQPEMFEVPD